MPYRRIQPASGTATKSKLFFTTILQLTYATLPLIYSLTNADMERRVTNPLDASN